MSPKSLPSAAFCEDVDEENGDPLPETRKVANVAAKRSKPELVRVRTHDGASDSGYSSHTAVTVGSSSPESKSKLKSALLRIDTKFLDATTKRPSLAQRRSETRQRANTKPSFEKMTTQRKRRESMREEICDCDECMTVAKMPVAKIPQSRRRPSEYHMPPPRYAVTPSPQTAVFPTPPYSQEVQVIQATPHPRPRASSSASYHMPRPVSFHGNVMPNMMPCQPFFPPGMEHGPPLSASAYANIPPPPYPPPNYPYVSAPPPSIQQRSQTPQTPTPYDQAVQQQPDQWDYPHPRRASMYGAPPVIQYESRPAPPPRRSTSRARPSEQRERDRGERDRNERDRNERDRNERDRNERDRNERDRGGRDRGERDRGERDRGERERDEDYYRMPPPQTIQIRRPALKQHVTTTAIQTRADSSDRQERIRREEYDVEPPRRRRPSLAVHPTSNRKSTSYTVPDSPKIAIESSRNRRVSYYGHEKRQDLEQRRRELAVEEYQHSKGTKGTPLTVSALDTLKQQRRRERRGSESGSRASSSTKGSDVKSRSASGNSTTTKGDGDTFQLRFNPSTGSIDLNGDSGSTIRIKPSAEGNSMELVIGGGREGKRYHGDGSIRDGSVKGRVQELREIEDRRREERSERGSRRSSRSGRSPRQLSE
ncbi:MAG: hypothetical protein M1834_004712 [Cirrosporium novae-zelandiae]|nr:MAG: hypothetical protein M1834_004712 [Cirrosporium novae-zelandiae]